MNVESFALSLGIGLAGGSAIFFAITLLTPDRQARKAGAIFAYTIGMIASIYFYKSNIDVGSELVSQISWRLVLVIFAFLAAIGAIIHRMRR